ncbi:MAG: TIM barrel protein [Cytophagaceae bacterium]
MKPDKQQIADSCKSFLPEHKASYEYLSEMLERRSVKVQDILAGIKAFQIAVPSWALSIGGTRFGRFPMGGEPLTLEQKVEDIGLLHMLTGSCGRISVHIPWDMPDDVQRVTHLLKENNLVIDSVNSNTFQDQPGQKYSYKFGSLCHTEKAVRDQAIQHHKEVIELGEKLNAKTLTVWLADGSNFPGQQNFRKAFQRTSDSLRQIHSLMKSDWNMLIEYKPFEPNFYSMVIPDWGSAYQLAKEAGERAQVLVDLGHHLPNTNIEQIVARLMHLGGLGGFHFNGSMYADDDLTTASIKPYQLFLIFNELVDGMTDREVKNPDIAWMIDASHNTKDPLEDLLQSVEGILIAYTQALLVDRKKLEDAQNNNDATIAQEIIQEAFRTDVRPLIAEARIQSGAALKPVTAYRELEVRKKLIATRSRL